MRTWYVWTYWGANLTAFVWSCELFCNTTIWINLILKKWIKEMEMNSYWNGYCKSLILIEVLWQYKKKSVNWYWSSLFEESEISGKWQMKEMTQDTHLLLHNVKHTRAHTHYSHITDLTVIQSCESAGGFAELVECRNHFLVPRPFRNIQVSVFIAVVSLLFSCQSGLFRPDLKFLSKERTKSKLVALSFLWRSLWGLAFLFMVNYQYIVNSDCWEKHGKKNTVSTPNTYTVCLTHYNQQSGLKRTG